MYAMVEVLFLSDHAMNQKANVAQCIRFEIVDKLLCAFFCFLPYRWNPVAAILSLMPTLLAYNPNFLCKEKSHQVTLPDS